MPVLKFLLVMSILLLVNNTMGYAKALNKTTVILMMSVIGAFLPSNLIMLGTMTVVSIHAVIGSLEAGGIVVAMLLITYLLFVRLYPTESLFIIGIVIAYKFNLPYIIPLLAGLFWLTSNNCICWNWYYYLVCDPPICYDDAGASIRVIRYC